MYWADYRNETDVLQAFIERRKKRASGTVNKHVSLSFSGKRIKMRRQLMPDNSVELEDLKYQFNSAFAKKRRKWGAVTTLWKQFMSVKANSSKYGERPVVRINCLTAKVTNGSSAIIQNVVKKNWQLITEYPVDRKTIISTNISASEGVGRITNRISQLLDLPELYFYINGSCVR